MSYNTTDNDFRHWYKNSQSSKSELRSNQLKEVILKKKSLYGYTYESEIQGQEIEIFIKEDYNPITLLLSESSLTEFYKYLEAHFPENTNSFEEKVDLQNHNLRIDEQNESNMIPKKRNYLLNNFLKMISSKRIKLHVFNFSLLAFFIAQINILQIHFNNYSLHGNWTRYSLIGIYFVIYFLCIGTYSSLYNRISSFKDFFKTMLLYTILLIIFLITEISLLLAINTDEFIIGFWVIMFVMVFFSGLGVSLITALLCSSIQKIKQRNTQIGKKDIRETKIGSYFNMSKHYVFASLIAFVLLMSFIDFFSVKVLKKDLRFLTEDNKESEISNQNYKILKVYNGNNKYHIPCIIIETNEELKEADLINIQKQIHKNYPDYNTIIRSLFKFKSESYAVVSSTIENFKFISDIQFIKDINDKYSSVVKEFIQKKISSELKDQEIYGIYYSLGECSKLVQNHPNYLTIITYDSSNNYFYSNFQTEIFDIKPIKFDGKKFILDKKVFQGIATPSVDAKDFFYINEFNDLLNKDLYYVDENSEKYKIYLHHLKY
jgi:UPF0716 family protein affecting phage T7 exclusion